MPGTGCRCRSGQWPWQIASAPQSRKGRPARCLSGPPARLSFQGHAIFCFLNTVVYWHRTELWRTLLCIIMFYIPICLSTLYRLCMTNSHEAHSESACKAIQGKILLYRLLFSSYWLSSCVIASKFTGSCLVHLLLKRARTAMWHAATVFDRLNL